MSSIGAKRPQFFEGQYLGAADLDALVAYYREQMARHRLGGHTWGIAMGLQLKEVESPAGNGEVDVYIQPGYAWDGFGRAVVVLVPYQLPPEKLKNVTTDGRVKVWLRYAQSETGAPPPGFETCETTGEYARVQETFDVIAGDFIHSEQHDKLSIVAESVDAMEAFYHLDSNDPLICDESIPFQIMPVEEENPRWLIPLGYVTWEPGVAGQAGRFKETTDETTIKLSRCARVYAGVVAESVQAADGVIRLRNRGMPTPSSGSFSAACDRQALRHGDLVVDQDGKLAVEDLVWVEGNLRAKGDIKLFGTKLDFRDSIGGEEPLWIQRVENNSPGPGGKDVQVIIGGKAEGNNRFAVGPKGEAEGDPLRTRFTVVDDGNVGIGLDQPSKLLHIKGSSDPTILLELDDTGGASGRLSFRQSEQTGADIYYDDAEDVKGLVFDTKDQSTSEHRMIIKPTGEIGIGTTEPTAYYGYADDLVVKTEGNTGITVVSGSSNAGRLCFADGTTGNMGYRGYLAYSQEHDHLSIGVAGRERMILLEEGNVGIGTSRPTDYFSGADDLVVETDGDTGITVVSGSTNLGLLHFADGTSSDAQYRGYLHYSHAADHMKIGVAGEDRMMILANGDIGIGIGAPESRLHVAGSKNAGADQASAHIAIIENESTGNSADVLALKIGASNQGAGNSFITFFAGTNPVGRIEGTSTGVTLASGGADFAERLPRLHSGEDIQAGDIVGVFGGSVTRETSCAEQLVVVSEQAIVVGRCSLTNEEGSHETVALVGQVPTRVRGAVRSGDYIVPSGLNDGTGVALPPDAVSLTENVGRIVGRAWESSSDEAIKLINTAVGIHAGLPLECFVSALREQEVKVRLLQEELERLRDRIQPEK